MKDVYNKTWLPIIKKSLIILAITLVVYLMCVWTIDLPLSKWASQHSKAGVMDFCRVISNIFDPTMMIAIIIIFFVMASIGLLTGKLKGLTINYFNSCALIIIVTDMVVSFLKIGLGRARPDLSIKNDIVGFFPLMNSYDYFSSPSGHVFMTACLVFVVFGFTQKQWIRSIALLCLFSVVFARIILLKHFLGDCILSIGLTWACFEYRSIIYNKLFGLISKERVHTSY
jgi:hypothetical protein